MAEAKAARHQCHSFTHLVLVVKMAASASSAAAAAAAGAAYVRCTASETVNTQSRAHLK